MNMRISAKTGTNTIAGAIVGEIEEALELHKELDLILLCIGAMAVNQAVKATAVAANILNKKFESENKTLISTSITPQFETITVKNNSFERLRLTVNVRKIDPDNQNKQNEQGK